MDDIEKRILQKIRDLFDQDDITADNELDEQDRELYISAPLGDRGAYVEFVVRVEVL